MLDFLRVGLADVKLTFDELARLAVFVVRLLFQKEVELDHEVEPHLAHTADGP